MNIDKAPKTPEYFQIKHTLLSLTCFQQVGNTDFFVIYSPDLGIGTAKHFCLIQTNGKLQWNGYSNIAKRMVITFDMVFEELSESTKEKLLFYLDMLV